MASGHPSFDVVNVGDARAEAADREGQMDGGSAALHRRRLAHRARTSTRPISASRRWRSPPAEDGSINVLPLNQDLFIIYYNKELLVAEGLQRSAEDVRRNDEHGARRSPIRRRASTASSGAGVKNANVVLYDSVLLGWDQETVDAGRQELLTDTPAGDRGRQVVPADHARMRARPARRVQLERVPDHVQPGPRRDVVGRHRLLRAAGRPDEVQRGRQGRLRAGARPARRRITAPPSSTASAFRRGQEQEGRLAVPANGSTGKQMLTEVLRTGSGTPAAAVRLRADRT